MAVYNGHLLDFLNKDRNGEKLFCDVIINVGREKFYGHRFLLDIASGYFRRMFRSFLIERYTNEVTIFGPHDDELTADTMERIFQYIYTREIDITKNNVYDILFAADYLDIKKLKYICLDFLLDIK